jgi:hypothetical protein|tara:strand:- start:104 stop:304 length:201 start_codon:yes stop_codon:yes gene_type:complete
MNNVTEIEMNADLTIATVDGVDYKVTDIHSWDDFGRTQETATLEGYGEIYSYDEAATWTDRGGEDW